MLLATTPLIGICTGDDTVTVNVVELLAANTADPVPVVVARFSVTEAGFGGERLTVAAAVSPVRIISLNEIDGTTAVVLT